MGLGFLPRPAARIVLLGCLIAASSASAQDIFVTPVANAPFSGVVYVARSVVRPDGSRMAFKTVRIIARDSQGRIHNEARELLPSSSTKQPEVTRILLYDPQTRISTWLLPQKRTFWTRTVNHPPSTVPPAFIAATTGSSLPRNDFAREEDLGTHEMEGLVVHGVRQTQSIPLGGGAGKEVGVIDEYWYSEDLHINLIVKHSDPRRGAVILTVTHIARTEPQPALFLIPKGYSRPKAKPRTKQ